MRQVLSVRPTATVLVPSLWRPPLNGAEAELASGDQGCQKQNNSQQTMQICTLSHIFDGGWGWGGVGWGWGGVGGDTGTVKGGCWNPYGWTGTPKQTWVPTCSSPTILDATAPAGSSLHEDRPVMENRPWSTSRPGKHGASPRVGTGILPMKGVPW